jgi:8-oxo-dGTP pyrophosphatase MutT (NUDIX family)
VQNGNCLEARLEKGETPEACLNRELKEELNCDVVVGNLLLTEVLEVIPGKLVLIIAYQCRLLTKKRTSPSAMNTKMHAYFHR